LVNNNFINIKDICLENETRCIKTLVKKKLIFLCIAGTFWVGTLAPSCTKIGLGSRTSRGKAEGQFWEGRSGCGEYQYAM